VTWRGKGRKIVAAWAEPNLSGGALS